MIATWTSAAPTARSDATVGARDVTGGIPHRYCAFDTGGVTVDAGRVPFSTHR